MIDNYKMPLSWAEANLSEIVDYKKGKKPKKMERAPFKNSLVYLDIRAIEKGTDEIFVDAESSNITNETELVIVWDGARAGWVGKSRNGALGSTLMALKPKIDKNYIFRFLQTQFQYLQTNHRGTGIPHVDPEIFWNIQVPIAPLPEQHRIVCKLDALFEKIESNKLRLEKIPKILKRFRQSVLAAAVSGKLTEDWREKNKNSEKAKDLFTKIQKAIDGKLEEETRLAKENGTRKPKDHRKNKKADFHETELESLPDVWDYFRLEDITYLVTDGTHHTPKYQNYGVKFLSVKNVRPFKIRDEDIKYISEKEHREINSRCNPERGDILYTKVGATFGYACVNELEYPFSIFVSLALIKPVSGLIDSKYLEAVMNSETVFKQARERISGIGTPDLHLIEIRDFKIPLCSIEEQKEIVKRLKSFFELADKLESRYTKAKAMLDKLPQSILAKAFRGELVTQNTEDEPASVLLEKIKEEKAKLLVSIKDGKRKKAKEYSLEEQPLKMVAEKKTKYKRAKARK